MKTKSIAMLCARRDHEAREGSAELPFGTMQARWMEATKPTGRTENTEPNWSSALRKRTLFPATALFAVLLIASSPLASADDSLSEALQKGLLEEEANHNLEAAIQAYQEAVNQFGDQRKIAATAVFRLGECYRKQGKTNEAAAHYERLCRDFPDQQQLVQLGQKYLMEWQRIGGAEGRSGDRVAPDQQLLDPDQVKLVQEEIKLAELQAADAKKSYE